MPYKYDSEKKFYINDEKDYQFIQALLRSGQTRGSIRNQYLLSRRLIEIIELDLMSFEEFIECPLTGKRFKEIPLAHIKDLGYNDRDDFCLKNNCKLLTFAVHCSRSNGNKKQKLSEESKQKIREKTTGRKHSQETLDKLSEMTAGDKNPAKRLDVRRKIKENHASNNPELWEKTVEKIRNKQKGRKFTEDHKRKLAEAKMRSKKYGSKAQRIAFEYIRRFLKHKNISVFGNDHNPFIGCSKNYSVDMSIPQYKIAIEWDGFWHWDNVNEKTHKSILTAQQRDIIKEKVLQDKGWFLIRIKDNNKDSSNNKAYAIEKCREFIPIILQAIESQPASEDWESDYKNKDYIKINLRDLMERIHCKKCNLWIMKRGNKTGLCRSCWEK